jgi:hypothetical protein
MIAKQDRSSAFFLAAGLGLDNRCSGVWCIVRRHANLHWIDVFLFLVEISGVSSVRPIVSDGV